MPRIKGLPAPAKPPAPKAPQYPDKAIAWFGPNGEPCFKDSTQKNPQTTCLGPNGKAITFETLQPPDKNAGQVRQVRSGGAIFSLDKPGCFLFSAGESALAIRLCQSPKGQSPEILVRPAEEGL